MAAAHMLSRPSCTPLCLSEKVYGQRHSKASEYFKTNLKFEWPPFFLQGYTDKDFASEGSINKEILLPVHRFPLTIFRQECYTEKGAS